MNTENPYAPPRARVSDLADTGDELELAGRAIRLGAYLLDCLVAAVMIGAPLAVGIVVGTVNRSGSSDYPAIAILLTFGGLAVWTWLTILYVSRNGQTIAKKWLGIKVVRTDGSQASLARIFWLRNVVNSLIGVIPFYFLIDPLVIFGDARQCVHDKVADTIVVLA